MNPMLKDALTGILRHALSGPLSWLVAKEVLQADQVEALIVGLAGTLIAAALSVWKSVRERREKVTALAMPPGSTENDAKAIVANGGAPSVSTPKDEVPQLNVAALKAQG